MRATLLICLLLATAFLSAACGGPKDPDTALADACERQVEEVSQEESGTPTAKSSEERLDEVTLVECAGQKVRVVAADAERTEGGSEEGEGAAEGAGEGADEEAAAGGGDVVPAKLDPEARETFASSCGSCHALSDAETSGQIGPNLDDTEFDAEGVQQQIDEGAAGMPADLLQGEEAVAVAEYVAAAAAQTQAE